VADKLQKHQGMSKPEALSNAAALLGISPEKLASLAKYDKGRGGPGFGRGKKKGR
jgi:hypothetical protein